MKLNLLAFACFESIKFISSSKYEKCLWRTTEARSRLCPRRVFHNVCLIATSWCTVHQIQEKRLFSPHRTRIGRHYEGILTTKLKRAERRGSQHTVPNGEGKKIQLGLVEWSKKNRAHAITVRVGDIWQLQVKDTWFALEASKWRGVLCLEAF